MREADDNPDESMARRAIRSRVADALEQLGHAREHMAFDERFHLHTEEGEVTVPIEILVTVAGRAGLLVKCIRGHTSSREEAAVALARLIPGGPAPFAVVANETDAVVIDTASRRTVGVGLDSLPGPSAVRSRCREVVAAPAAPGNREREMRILATYVRLRCPVPKGPY